MNSENNNGYFMIKTFEDACNVLGNEDPLVEEYFRVSNLLSEDTQIVLKLRIISKALNNGWEPIFNEDELRYYPVYSMGDDIVGETWTSRGLTSVCSRFNFKTREICNYFMETFDNLIKNYIFGI